MKGRDIMHRKSVLAALLASTALASPAFAQTAAPQSGSPGDPDAMAATIAGFVALPERKRRRMRRAARRSASRYGQSRVTDQWAALFDDIVRRRWPVPATERVRRRARSGVRVVRSRVRGMRRRLR